MLERSYKEHVVSNNHRSIILNTIYGGKSQIKPQFVFYTKYNDTDEDCACIACERGQCYTKYG
jgi:hypothetical protein